MNKRTVGGRYEKTACEFLRKKGFRLLTANFRTRSGEIDLIMEDDSTIVFVEVKYRSVDFYGRGEEHVDKRKQKTIAQVAKFFLLRYGLSDRYCRFDVVSIDGDVITHFENAFELR